MMAISDKLNELEKAVEEGKQKQQAMNDANSAAQKAKNDYEQCVKKIEGLKSELNDSIANIFPSDARVRVSK